MYDYHYIPFNPIYHGYRATQTHPIPRASGSRLISPNIRNKGTEKT